MRIHTVDIVFVYHQIATRFLQQEKHDTTKQKGAEGTAHVHTHTHTHTHIPEIIEETQDHSVSSGCPSAMKIIFTALRGPKKSRLIPQLETAPVGALSLEAVDMYERYLCEIDNQYLLVSSTYQKNWVSNCWQAIARRR